MVVFGVGGFAKVDPSVVGPVHVDVVNLLNGPDSGHVKPCKAMGSVRGFSVNLNGDVAIRRSSGFFPDPLAVPSLGVFGTV